jgi:exodeoxyribonuclease VII large subunit
MFKDSFLLVWPEMGCIMLGMTDETVLDRGEQASAAGNLREYSVSELSNHLKRTVEDGFSWVRVRGEISRVARNSSGHCYFDLKDDRAVLSSVIWKGTFARIQVKPEQGLEVVCSGRITTFASKSQYQIVVEEMELAGLGALMAMLEARKKKLAGEGLFDAERKKKIPFLPEVIGVVTSPTGAVIRDIMHRLGDRCPRHVLLWPVSVQGDRAASDVAAAIRGFNALPRNGIARPDVLIVARGGGSFEDLLPFSEEVVVRAAAESSIPLISAVGHETDTTLIDFASDKRAPTPSAAAEMAVPVLRDCAEHVAALQQRQLRAISRAMDQRQRQLTGLARSLPRVDSLFALPRQRFDACSGRLRQALFVNLQRQRGRFARVSAMLRPRIIAVEIERGRECVADYEARMQRAFWHRVHRAATTLESCVRVLESLSYRAVLARGFVLVRGASGALRRRASSVEQGERLTLTFADGQVKAVSADAAAKSRKIGFFRSKSQGDLF